MIEQAIKYYLINKILLTIIIFFLFYSTFIINNIYLTTINKKSTNNEGFLRINTTHKSKFSHYNYTNNIEVYKDLYNNISYIPINDSNFIIKSKRIPQKKYFEYCKNKILLDDTKYKRSLKPAISIIIPFYNLDKFSIFIPLRSIQNQSLKDIEIIIVDDGSSDNIIKEIIKEMENDNRIILLKHKKNKGTLITRVDGVRYASGEFILNIDQDDLYIDNTVFQKIYVKAKRLNVDILQFSTSCYNISKISKLEISVPKGVLISQPELQIAFLNKIGDNRLSHFSTRMIWDKFVKRTVYLDAIINLGDEYLNHKFYFYEDTLMMFELSQIGYSYYYYNIFGYRQNIYDQARSRESISNKENITAMNQLYFIKLLLNKIPPSYDRYHIYREWGFEGCGSEVIYIDRKDIDLLKEVIEIIDELDKLYNNTDKKLLECVKQIKKRFDLT